MARNRNSSEVHDRVLAVLQENAASLLKIARRHSLCDDDAQDAYQRGLEIYLQRLDRVDPATAGAWLRTVVKHEAMAIRAQRARWLNSEEVDFDALVAPEVSSGEERVVAFDHITRAAEALRGCKRDEVAAMVLKADGHSYDDHAGNAGGWVESGDVRVEQQSLPVTPVPSATPVASATPVPPRTVRRSTRLRRVTAVWRRGRLTIRGAISPAPPAGIVRAKLGGRRYVRRFRGTTFRFRLKVSRRPRTVTVRYRGDATHAPAARRVRVATAR